MHTVIIRPRTEKKIFNPKVIIEMVRKKDNASLCSCQFSGCVFLLLLITPILPVWHEAPLLIHFLSSFVLFSVFSKDLWYQPTHLLISFSDLVNDFDFGMGFFGFIVPNFFLPTLYAMIVNVLFLCSLLSGWYLSLSKSLHDFPVSMRGQIARIRMCLQIPKF